jgi:RNA polymerase sigma factor (sigma-70 family)
MQTRLIDSVIKHLHQAVLLPESSGPGDGELLGRFIDGRDETAFAMLVNRHGPMVWGVCRRLLHQHDAEDAFQATFLVLACKAASIHSRGLVGNWLYGVAHQTALQTRRTSARRRAREVQVMVMPDAEAKQPDSWDDVQTLLDEELSRLPEIYRAVLVLCDLQGRTRKEVACLLGVPEGTVGGRLARARTMLAKRLTERGVALSGGAMAGVLAQQASAGVPKEVTDSTVEAAMLLSAGMGAIPEAVSSKVAVLTEGVIKAMLFSKLRSAIAIGLILGLLATGTTVLAYRAAAGVGDTPPTAEEVVNVPEIQKLVGGEVPVAKLELAKGLKLTLSADKTETVLKPGTFYGADPVQLKLSIINTSDKPIKLDAYALEFRIKFQCDGPSPDSVKKQVLYLDMVLGPPTEKDYPVLQPGKSWSPIWLPAFPGDIPDGIGTIAAYSLRQPGIYKLRMTVYDTYAPHVEGAAEGTKLFESNVLEVKVREEKAPPGKVEPAKGLKLTLSADETETVMKPDGSNAEPRR